jgi:hypothetical protein
MTFIRYRDQKPPVNTPLLILIDGEIREGYIDEVLLLGNVLPTHFQTVHYPEREQWKDQHSYWGYDPYWMLAPEKPKQETDPRTSGECRESLLKRPDVSGPDEHLERSFAHMLTMSDDELIEVSQSISQGKIQKRAREILLQRNVIYRHETGWVYTPEFLANHPQPTNGHFREA